MTPCAFNQLLPAINIINTIADIIMIKNGHSFRSQSLNNSAISFINFMLYYPFQHTIRIKANAAMIPKNKNRWSMTASTMLLTIASNNLIC